MNKKIAVTFIALSLFSDQLLANSFFNKVKKTTSKAASTTNKTVIKPTDTKVIQPTNASVAQPVYDDTLLPTENNVIAPTGDALTSTDAIRVAGSIGGLGSTGYTIALTEQNSQGNDAFNKGSYRSALLNFLRAIGAEFELGYTPTGQPSLTDLWDKVSSCLNKSADQYKGSAVVIDPSTDVQNFIDQVVSDQMISVKDQGQAYMYKKAASILYTIGVSRYKDDVDSSVGFFIGAYNLNKDVFNDGDVSIQDAATAVYEHAISLMNAVGEDGLFVHGVSAYKDYFIIANQWDSSISLIDCAKLLSAHATTMMNAKTDSNAQAYTTESYTNCFVIAREWDSSIALPDKAMNYYEKYISYYENYS